MGPKYLVIKKGEHGALLFHGDKVSSHLPFRWKKYLTLPVQAIHLPVALSDILPKQKISFENMKTAIIVGSCYGKFLCRKIRPKPTERNQHQDIDARIRQFGIW